jgi:hypothetical protein
MVDAEQQRTGKIAFLQVQEKGRIYGEPGDQIDVRVVVGLDTFPLHAFGFDKPSFNPSPDFVYSGMVDILRDAFNNNWTTTIYYTLPLGNVRNGLITRIHINKESMMM